MNNDNLIVFKNQILNQFFTKIFWRKPRIIADVIAIKNIVSNNGFI